MKTEDTNKFILYISDATRTLQIHKYDESFQYILEALNENPNSPVPQNLLGIWYEFQGNSDLARKHYRAAYALDPTYKPASNNLERISTFFSAHKISVDFGEEQREK